MSGRLARVALLSVRQLVATKGRVALLVVMVAVSLLIFVSVQALALASRTQLDDAIEADLGVEGVYEAQVPADVGLGTEQLARLVADAALGEGAAAALVLAEHGSVDTSCPVDAPQPVDRQVYAVLVAVEADRLAPNASRPNETEPVCLDGVPLVDEASTSVPLADLLRVDEQPVGLTGGAEDDAAIAFGPPERLLLLTTFGAGPDRTTELRASIVAALREPAARAGRPETWSEAITVSRTDQGASVRDAGRGVSLVYQALGWGVLVLGGLAVLVAQLMNTQARTWFYGLARVTGATTSDLVALIAIEVTTVIVLGSGLAIGVAAAVGPALEGWSERTFQAELRLLHPTTLPLLVLGSVLLAVLGAALPAIRAARLDPLAALEA